MLKDLLRFEWYYHTRKPLFYITVIAFAVIGFLVGNSNGISFPNVYKNSPYQVSYLVGILSLAAIFSITLSVAQSFLRESETRFDAIIYATPVSKFTYLLSRVSSIAFIAIVSFSMAVVGMYVGHVLSWSPEFKTGTYSFITYAWPLLVFAIPNIILCIAVLCGTAWLTRSKLTVYVAGLLIYVLYIIASIFANSPLIAGATPSTPEEMSLFAKLDPLGMAAFFEQTKYWTALERNTHHLVLNGNFLLNRVIWLGVAAVILVISYVRFSFRSVNNRPAKKERTTKIKLTAGEYHVVKPQIHTRKHNLSSLISFFKIDALSIFKGIPFILIMILWTALLGIEISSAVKGDPRLGQEYATTGLMISVIMDTIPLFALLVILFYSSEIIWRSRSVNFYGIESTAPVNPTVVFLSRLLSLAIIPLFLVGYSCLIGIFFQIINGFVGIDIGLYFSLFYFIGLPLLLCIVLVTAIQTLIRNKYAGLTIASIVVLLTTANPGRMVGIRHPLVRYADMLTIDYSGMNGFGAYTTAFNWQMLYWTALAVCIVIVSGKLWNKGAARMGGMQKVLLAICLLVFVGSGSYIFLKTTPYRTESSINKWRENYERQYRKYENMLQPAIAKVTAKVDLYPSEQRYAVNGEYLLVNNTGKAIDTLLIYINRNTKLGSLSIAHAKLVKDESSFGHYWYVLDKQLQQGDSVVMKFNFTSGWSPFKGHIPFNSIVDNGSFIRMSNYFPSLGYEVENELTNSIERERRQLEKERVLAGIDSEVPGAAFTMMDIVVTTSADQRVIGVGELVKEWNKDGRNYFHYKSERPMPFRFAFSSARYKVKKDAYANISIEVYYDEKHAANVDSLIANAKRTLQYCETNFGKYPHKVIRFAEVSGFAEGFAATAYPAAIFMKENGGFYNNLSKGSQEDIINQLAGHELSHQWWGTDSYVAVYKAGGWILTETLAKYTELMLYRQAHGLEASLEIVREHIDQYLTNRSFSPETPLYRTTFETPHLPYNKGTVVMHQLEQLVGDSVVNRALRSFLAKHAYPNPQPGVVDLLNEIYAAAPAKYHAKIDELFKQIIIYDSKMEDVRCVSSGKSYNVQFKASVLKYNEDGSGRRSKGIADSTIDVGVYTAGGKLYMQSFQIQNNKVVGALTLPEKPVRIVIDPHLKTMDSFLKDNEKVCDYAFNLRERRLS